MMTVMAAGRSKTAAVLSDDDDDAALFFFVAAASLAMLLTQHDARCPRSPPPPKKQMHATQKHIQQTGDAQAAHPDALFRRQPHQHGADRAARENERHGRQDAQHAALWCVALGFVLCVGGWGWGWVGVLCASRLVPQP